jgi:hypothetical protein
MTPSAMVAGAVISITIPNRVPPVSGTAHLSVAMSYILLSVLCMLVAMHPACCLRAIPCQQD